jgi:hypothetical protein
MSITDKEILENWNELIRIINTTFTGERKEKILKLHEHFEDRMPYIPASGKGYYHNAFPGGYVQHVLHVIQGGKILKDAWEKMGCTINFTDEELVFSCLFHDLGKVGDLDTEYYIPQEDQWRRNKMNEIYTLNPKLDFMQVTDRTFWLLSQFGITYSTNEFLGIRLADGLYAEYNKSYLITYGEQFIPKSNIVYIVHAADFMAMHSEFDAWRRSGEEPSETNKSKEPKYTKKQTLSDIAKTSKPDSTLANFDDLFTSFDNISKNKGD